MAGYPFCNNVIWIVGDGIAAVANDEDLVPKILLSKSIDTCTSLLDELVVNIDNGFAVTHDHSRCAGASDHM